MFPIMKRNLMRVSAGLLAVTIAGPAVAQDQPTIASISFLSDQFFRKIQEGVRDAAEERDARVLEINVDGDQARETQAIETYIARDVDAIVISPLSATASAPAIQRARDAGIVVVALNGGLEDNSIPNATFSSPNYNLGKSTGEQAAEFVSDEMDGSANVAIMAFSSLLPEQSGQRTGGFKDHVGTMGNDINLVTEQDAWTPERAVTVATDIMTANPNVNLLYAANEGGTVGALQAVRNMGRAGEVFVFGIDGSEQLARALLSSDNVLQATTAQQPYVMGEMGANAALDILNGESVPREQSVPPVLLARGDREGIMEYLESQQ